MHELSRFSLLGFAVLLSGIPRSAAALTFEQSGMLYTSVTSQSEKLINQILKGPPYFGSGFDIQSIQKQEKAFIEEINGEYNSEEKLRRIGQVMLAGITPDPSLDEGATGLLTFQFVQAGTGLPDPGPAIGSVLYQALLDPDMPAVFTTIGESADAASDFAVSFTVEGFEPTILATPYDTSGNPIFLDGLDDLNVAQALLVDVPVEAVPEPSSISVAAAGVFGMAGLLQRRRRRRLLF